MGAEYAERNHGWVVSVPFAKEVAATPIELLWKRHGSDGLALAFLDICREATDAGAATASGQLTWR